MSNDTDKPDLSTVTTDELIEEIKRRHEAALFVLEKPTPTGDDTHVIIEYHGGLSRSIGMAVRARSILVRDANNGHERLD